MNCHRSRKSTTVAPERRTTRRGERYEEKGYTALILLASMARASFCLRSAEHRTTRTMMTFTRLRICLEGESALMESLRSNAWAHESAGVRETHHSIPPKPRGRKRKAATRAAKNPLAAVKYAEDSFRKCDDTNLLAKIAGTDNISTSKINAVKKGAAHLLLTA